MRNFKERNSQNTIFKGNGILKGNGHLKLLPEKVTRSALNTLF